MAPDFLSCFASLCPSFPGAAQASTVSIEGAGGLAPPFLFVTLPSHCLIAVARFEASCWISVERIDSPVSLVILQELL